MKLRLLAMVGLGLLSACTDAASTPNDRYARLLPLTADPSAVVASEIAFARAAREEGQWTAFAKYATDHAAMFVPEPVNARDWLKSRLNPARAVAWQPHDVWSSCDGSLAVTRGGWQRPDGTVGWFMTVWERQGDRSYRWVIDHGDALQTPLTAPDLIRTRVAECPPAGAVAGLAEQAQQSRPPESGTYFDHVSSDSSLFLTFVVDPKLGRHWKLMGYSDGKLQDWHTGSVAPPAAP